MPSGVRKFVSKLVSKMLVSKNKSKIRDLVKDDPEFRKATEDLEKSVADYVYFLEKNKADFSLNKDRVDLFKSLMDI